MKLFRTWKPKGKMYSLKCNQCGSGFLSSYHLEAPICGVCLQKAKSLDSTIEYDKKCITCGRQGVIYRKEYCHSCYFGFGKKENAGSMKVQLTKKISRILICLDQLMRRPMKIQQLKMLNGNGIQTHRQSFLFTIKQMASCGYGHQDMHILNVGNART